jgi:hypothetical protein
MIRFTRQLLVLPLVACLLLVPVLASPATVAHEAQHSHHHKAATHSSPLCAWFCGAGQGLDLQGSVFVPAITLLAILDLEPADQVEDVDAILFPSRGPPSVSS